MTVRSFGTEDRHTQRPVAPKDEVYEFIIFRGADIKGIDVLEPPPPGKEAGGEEEPVDPAIVEVQHYVSLVVIDDMAFSDERGDIGLIVFVAATTSPSATTAAATIPATSATTNANWVTWWDERP